MRRRVGVLAAKRTEAKQVFDGAVAERQRFLLEGDLSDEKVADRLQKAVDVATSRVSGFDSALLALRTQIDDAEMRLRAEQEQAERDRVASAMQAAIVQAENSVAPWLDLTRKFIATLGALSPGSFEVGQAGEYLAKICGELELALAVALPDLHRHVEAIRSGHQAVPRFPKAEPEVLELQALPSATSAGEPVRMVFALKPIKWRDLDGSREHLVRRWEDCEVPERLLARATQRGAVTLDMSDKQRRENRRILRGFTTPPSAYIDLDAELLPPLQTDLPPGFERLPVGAERKISFVEPRR